jgi:hypothetical protein
VIGVLQTWTARLAVAWKAGLVQVKVPKVKVSRHAEATERAAAQRWAAVVAGHEYHRAGYLQMSEVLGWKRNRNVWGS